MAGIIARHTIQGYTNSTYSVLPLGTSDPATDDQNGDERPAPLWGENKRSQLTGRGSSSFCTFQSNGVSVFLTATRSKTTGFPGWRIPASPDIDALLP